MEVFKLIKLLQKELPPFASILSWTTSDGFVKIAITIYAFEIQITKTTDGHFVILVCRQPKDVSVSTEPKVFGVHEIHEVAKYVVKLISTTPTKAGRVARLWLKIRTHVLKLIPMSWRKG